MKLKTLLISLFLSLVGFLHANNLGSYSYTLDVVHYSADYQIENVNINEAVSIYVEAYFLPKSYRLELVNQLKSPAGLHLTYQVYKDEFPILHCLLKAHVDLQNKLYLVAWNNLGGVAWNEEVNLPKIDRLSATNESAKITQKHPVFLVVNGRGVLAQKVVLEETKKDVYLERLYVTSEDYFERDLRFFNDTLLHGQVFNPDPLSTSNSEYGGLYIDGSSSTVDAIVLVALENDFTSPLGVPPTPFTYNGTSFLIDTTTFVNDLASDSLFIYFSSISLDGGVLADYSLQLTSSAANLTTEIIAADLNSAALNNEREWAEVRGTFNGGIFDLQNELFAITEMSLPVYPPVSSLTDTFTYTRSEQGFEDFNAFYHLNNFHEHLLHLGFTSLHKQRITVDTHGANGGDNSFYSHQESYDTISANPLVLDTVDIRNILVFGEGGVDDAEDADVVVHEYGHAISFFIAPFTNIGTERQGIDEGFGDYLAASYSRSLNEFGWYDVFTWDGHNEFWNGRSAETDKTANDIDLAQSIYFLGEIWSSTLMELWEVLGRDITDQLAIQAMYFNMPNGQLQDVANNLLLSDELLFNGAHTCEIIEVLQNRRFTQQFCIDGRIVEATGLNVFDSEAFAEGSGNVSFFIGEENFTRMDVSVYDVNGALLFLESNITTPRFTLSPETFPVGVLVVRLRTNRNRYETKLLKLTH